MFTASEGVVTYEFSNKNGQDFYLNIQNIKEYYKLHNQPNIRAYENILNSIFMASYRTIDPQTLPIPIGEGVNLDECHIIFGTVKEMSEDDRKYITSSVSLILFEYVTSKDKNLKIDLFFEVFNKILPLATNIKISNRQKDWYDAAINHEIGYITLALITLVIQESDESKREFLSCVNHLDTLLKSVQNKDCNIYVKVILAHNLYKLYDLIPEWTKSHIIPLLSWKNNKQDTYQYWCSYLSYNYTTVSKNLAQDVKADLLLSFDNLECFINQQTRRHLIYLAILLCREEAITLENISSKL